MSGKRRVEASRLAQHEPTGSALGPECEPGQHSRRHFAGCVAPYAGLERTHELDERPNGLHGALTLDGEPGTDSPRELRLLRIEPGCHATHLPQRHAALEVALQTATRLRGLACVDAIEKERLGEVVAVCMREQPRPQLVVLALEVRGVVAKPVCLEHLPVDEDARMEERGAEERSPAQGDRPDRHHVELTYSAQRIQLHHRASHDGYG